FYGFGPNSSESNQATFTQEIIGEEFTWELPVGRSWFIDLSHSFYGMSVNGGPITTLPSLMAAFPSVFNESSIQKGYLAHRMAVTFDDTDHPVVPRLGSYLTLSALTSQRSMGSSFTYQTYAAQMKHYYNWKGEGKYITALYTFVQQQTGERLPFYAQSVVGESTGLRVVGEGRYVDRGKLVATVEERIRISQSPILRFISELEVSPFLDMATVFSEPKYFDIKNLHLGPGVAFRVVLRPQVVGTFDFVFGTEGPNFLIHVGYPF
ncbi:MAG: BamA/TamA family outer membrane protein, partial [Elusimicrobia bacterium]|nr:BamA/TamA family outer membrane protein [Elusimicrobiota bacterium]